MFISTVYQAFVHLREDQCDLVLRQVRNGLVLDDGLK